MALKEIAEFVMKIAKLEDRVSKLEKIIEYHKRPCCHCCETSQPLIFIPDDPDMNITYNENQLLMYKCEKSGQRYDILRKNIKY